MPAVDVRSLRPADAGAASWPTAEVVRRSLPYGGLACGACVMSALLQDASDDESPFVEVTRIADRDIVIKVGKEVRARGHAEGTTVLARRT
jgi:hypothetical protein